MKRTAIVIIVAALTLAATANAAPRFTKNGAFLTEGAAGKTAMTAWGTLKLQTILGGTASYECRNAAAGMVENPGGATVPGAGQVELAASYSCTVSTCPTYADLFAQGLPWPMTLEESELGQYRVRIGALPNAPMKVAIQCWPSKAASEEAERGAGENKPNAGETLVGTVSPRVEHGTSATTPGQLRFDAGAGALEQEGSQGTITSAFVGSESFFGYEKQPVINVQ